MASVLINQPCMEVCGVVWCGVVWCGKLNECVLCDCLFSFLFLFKDTLLKYI